MITTDEKNKKEIPLWEQAEFEMREQMIEKDFTTKDVQEDLRKMRKESEKIKKEK